MLALVVGLLMGFATLIGTLLWITSPTYSSTEPPPIPHTWPFLGHALSFVNDVRGVMERTSAQAKGEPYSLLVAGKKNYVFTSLPDIASIHRAGKILTLQNFLRSFRVSQFGMTTQEAQAVFDATPLLHELNTKHIFNSTNNAVTAREYFAALYESLDELEKEVEDTASVVKKDGLVLVANTQGKATTMAYYGRKLIEINPDFMNVFIEYIDGFWPMMFRAPSWLYSKPFGARERMVKNVENLIKYIDEDESVTSPFFAEKIKAMRLQGLSENTICRDIFSVNFGINANSIPTSYLCLLRILSRQGLVDEIRAELAAAPGYSKASPSDRLSYFPESFPVLRAVFWETLRLHNTSLTVREVLEPYTIVSRNDSSPDAPTRTYKLEKGGIITSPGGLVHMNPKLHPDPKAFRPKRFLPQELGGDGGDYKKTMRPFGGGSSYCPGRVFAEKQVMGFIAAMLDRFDVDLANGERFMGDFIEGTDQWGGRGVWIGGSFQIPDTANFETMCKDPRAILELRRRRA